MLLTRRLPRPFLARGLAAVGDALQFTPLAGEGALELPAGRPTLVVNTASLCGLTPQLTQMQELAERYEGRVTVLAVPSNDFGSQEPWAEPEVKEFYEKEHGASFKMAGKCEVLGPNAHAFFQAVTDEVGAEGAPSWNFQKYLVGSDGELKAIFEPTVEPTDGKVVQALELALR